MSLFRRAIRKLREWQGEPVAPSHPSRQQQDMSKAILDFAATTEWDVYQEWLETRLGRAVGNMFQALRSHDEKAVFHEAVRIQVYYDLLRDVDEAVSINKRTSEVKV